MSEKRKDNKGKVLKTGESQRKDLLYQYRYKDCFGEIKYIYSNTLEELREEEKVIQKNLERGLDYVKGRISVIELVKRYVGLKRNVRRNTKVGYNYVINILEKEAFAQKSIREIKASDAQQWIIKLSNDGRGYSTLTTIKGVLSPAFQMAYDEDIILKNPFNFKLTDFVVNDSKKRVALTEAQKDRWMEFIRNDNTYSKYYDEFVVLLNTGLRVSEFCGLTFKDLDFENRKINVDHQLLRTRNDVYEVEKTKTESGIRYIPMSEEVYRSLKNIIAKRAKVKTEMIVDGYSGFIMLDKNKKPKVALHIENECRWAFKKYSKLYPDTPLPKITPHVYRHTFCTELYQKGLDVKNLQYIMGHSEARTTMNIYTHSDYEMASKAMIKIIDFTTHNSKDKKISNAS